MFLLRKVRKNILLGVNTRELQDYFFAKGAMKHIYIPIFHFHLHFTARSSNFAA